MWPLAVIAINWIAFALLPFIPDPLILMTYLGFGLLLLGLWWKGADALALTPINDAREIRFALFLTGAALVASGLTDIFLMVDFIRNEGRNAGLVLTFVQTAFVLVIGLSASFGRASAVPEPEREVIAAPPAPTEHDSDIVLRLETLFKQDGPVSYTHLTLPTTPYV